ncbi:type II secretion system minor pseudopilin GspJ [Pseudomonas gingeri]|uniref:type II secretion system minor pseudopilin GspJ n=1 Tax=Pseudomonas gingeri TaxID=117681 RepID=UPI0015A1EECD|nr:type II secretion system minor pseudopilin GspJ [Pseudomonas gingeri]NWD66283.1 type II secretion system minor pseudopilin GspJ [Pseudomonas gingeri]
MNRQGGFTLVELVIALAIFSLIGLASYRLYEGVLLTQARVSAHEQGLRRLQRAMALLERDVMQATIPKEGVAVTLNAGQLNLRRGNARNPLDEPRSERQEVAYRLEDGALWRYQRHLDLPETHKQLVLKDVRALQWRLYVDKVGWRSDGASTPGRTSVHPRALEITLSVDRFEQIRRVILLPEGL